jgi:hypothetical protein
LRIFEERVQGGVRSGLLVLGAERVAERVGGVGAGQGIGQRKACGVGDTFLALNHVARIVGDGEPAAVGVVAESFIGGAGMRKDEMRMRPVPRHTGGGLRVHEERGS